MKNSHLGADALSTKVIPNVNPALAKELSLKLEHRSLGIVISDCGDVTCVALDGATEAADVAIVYGESMYIGAVNTSTRLAGKVIGTIAGSSSAKVNSSLSVITQIIEEEASFYSANEDDSIVYFAHVVSRTGSFLSEQANIPGGEVIVYLIAPPLEIMVGLDAAMKAADIQMGVLYGPPSETSFGGALLTGSQSACKAACSAFEQVIQNIVNNPLSH